MKACPQCGEMECVFFQSQQRTEDTKMVSPSVFPYQLGAREMLMGFVVLTEIVPCML
jgi:hypothetical protein